MEASSVRVRPLTTGVVRPKRGDRGARRYLPGGWDDATLPVHAFLVEHPAGALLFDTGQEAAAAGPGYFPRWHPFFRLSRFELGPEHEVAAQLERLGRPPSELRWVVLSHLHTDHVGGIAACAAAEILVSATEWQRARGLGGRVRGYLPGRWPSGLRPRLLPLDTDPFGPFSASHDVAGDGSLLVVPLPGHTPGHVGLLVRDARAPVLRDLRRGVPVLIERHTALLMQDAAEVIARYQPPLRKVAFHCRILYVTVINTGRIPTGIYSR